MLLTTLIFSFLSSPVFALEPTNPITLCDRFVAVPERKNCEEQMATLQPDWYLASVCDKVSDDTAFYDCLITSQTMELSPKKLAACEKTDLGDEARVECVRNAKVTQLSGAYQNKNVGAKSPASKKSEKKK